ncbi:MAG: sugar-transfer associated ATP-grasp domain-containing protein [Halofilum sp. (in: g-proteobacteria)]
MGTPYDYVCVFQDKLLFERYFAAGGLPVVASEFVVRPARLIEPGGDAISVDDLIASGKPQRLFCKPQCGIRGANTFMLDIGANGLFIDGAPAEPSMLEDRLGDERYLFQRPITQHEQIAKLHPTSVNTLRVVTYRRADDTEVLSVSLRMGADGDITDNAGANRVFAGIRDEEGRLIETGYRATGERFFETRTHPTTGVRFRDCAIPFYRECLDLARRAHAWIPEVYSVGWDIAVTPEGPRLLEGNDDWSGRVMLMVPGFRDRVLRAHDLLDTGSPARLAPGEASAAARHH